MRDQEDSNKTEEVTEIVIPLGSVQDYLDEQSDQRLLPFVLVQVDAFAVLSDPKILMPLFPSVSAPTLQNDLYNRSLNRVILEELLLPS